MYLRQQPRVNYAAFNCGGNKSITATMASNSIHENMDFSSAHLTPASKLSTPVHTNKSQGQGLLKAEIDALEAELSVLDMKEKLSMLQLEVLKKKEAVKDLQHPIDFLSNPQLQTLPSHQSSFTGMPSYRAFLGLGAGIGDCQYYDTMQFVDVGMTGLGVPKGRCATGKMQPDKIAPEWDDDIANITPLMWTGASMKILSRLIDEGELDTEGILKYLTYMLRFTQMEVPYTWKSLLLYDRRCRIMQAATKSGWDEEPAGVASTTLVKKPQGNEFGARPRDNTGARKMERKPRLSVNIGGRDIEVCMKFNEGRCEYRPCPAKPTILYLHRSSHPGRSFRRIHQEALQQDHGESGDR